MIHHLLGSLSAYRFLVICGAFLSPAAEAVIFADDFSSSTLTTNPNGYLGGWYSSQISFGEWVADTGHASISGGLATVDSTSGVRSLAIVIDPANFSGAGTHTLTFDVSSYSGDGDDTGLVRIWQGSGYNLGLDSADGIQVDTQAGSFEAFGSAEAEQLADFSFTTTGSAYSIDFDYDGSSAVGIFLGVQTSAWPFPEASFDNISLSSAAAIPEPTGALSASLIVLGLLWRNRK